jgi:methionyl-tRNA formyltransferase
VDAFVVTAYGKRLSCGVLALPRLGCFNIHASLLPKYRGAAPIEHAILRGESETGITIQRMAAEIDAGPILARRVLRIGEEETAGGLSARLSALAAEMIVPFLDAVEAGAVEEQPQEAVGATRPSALARGFGRGLGTSFAPRLKKKDGLVPWQADARAVCNFIRAMTPWPGAFTFHRPASGAFDHAAAHPPGTAYARWPGGCASSVGEKQQRRPEDARTGGEGRGRLILLAARPTGEPCAGAAPGEIVRADSLLVVATGSGCVSVLRVKPEGGGPMDAAAYLRGRALKVGDSFHGA